MKIGGVTITSGTAGMIDRTNWTERQIRGSERKTVLGAWVSVLFPTLFALFLFWISKMPVFMAKNIPNPVLLVFGLVTVGMLIKAIWETIRLNRFGDPMLELNAAPIPLGGTVEGRISFSYDTTQQAPEFTVTLACIHHIHSTGQHSNIDEKVLWSTEKKSSLLLGGTLPISMSVPTDQPQTNDANPFDRILWRLTVKAPFRGQAFLEKYEVPVSEKPT